MNSFETLSEEELRGLTREQLEAAAELRLREKARAQHQGLTLQQFLTDPHYLGNANIWRSTRETLLDIDARQPREIVLPWGIGSGKSMCGALYLCWLAYKHLPAIADRSFFQRYQLKGDKPVFMFVLATRLEQARDSIFAEVQGAIRNSPWFMENYPPAHYKHQVQFTQHGKPLPFIVRPLGASPRGPLALDCFACAIDEAGFWVESAGKLGDSAEEINNRIRTRMVSRFLDAGVLLNLSAPRYVGDFVQRRARQIEQNGDVRAYCSRKAVWECKPELVAEVERGEGAELPHPETGRPTFVPASLVADFEANPELAWREYGGVPSLALEAFDPTAAQFLSECATLETLPQAKPGHLYYIHGDLALTGDRAALAMVHPEADGRIVLDRLEEIPKREDTRSVEINDVKDRILQWKAQKFGIAQASFDQFQSADLIQRLSREGVRSETVSVDKTLEGYNALKTAIHEKRFAYWSGTKNIATFIDEYARLELVRGVKADHAPGGSKDFSDAVAGAVWQASLNVAKALPLSERIRFR